MYAIRSYYDIYTYDFGGKTFFNIDNFYFKIDI